MFDDCNTNICMQNNNNNKISDSELVSCSNSIQIPDSVTSYYSKSLNSLSSMLLTGNIFIAK